MFLLEANDQIVKCPRIGDDKNRFGCFGRQDMIWSQVNYLFGKLSSRPTVASIVSDSKLVSFTTRHLGLSPAPHDTFVRPDVPRLLYSYISHSFLYPLSPTPCPLSIYLPTYLHRSRCSEHTHYSILSALPAMERKGKELPGVGFTPTFETPGFAF